MDKWDILLPGSAQRILIWTCVKSLHLPLNLETNSENPSQKLPELGNLTTSYNENQINIR